MSLAKAIDDLLAFAPDDMQSIPQAGERRDRFDALDLAVAVEAHQLGYDGKLPSLWGGVSKHLGLTNLPGVWTMIPPAFHPTGQRPWRNALLVLRVLDEAGIKVKADNKGEQPTEQSKEPHPPRLNADVACKTILLDGVTYDVSSDLAVRWVKVLADHPGEWISGKQLEKYDTELINAKTNRLKPFLPIALLSLIDSETGKGSRLRL